MNTPRKTSSEIRAFKRTVLAHFQSHGRDLPWRKTRDPYRILVSEFMLQQTQVDRVIPKYRSFLKAFPNVSKLARAPLGDVLLAWQGLGYNRRAHHLHEASKEILKRYQKRVPKRIAELETLPGVGPYTARAVATFAYGEPIVCIETNIRSAVLFHFFKEEERVSDKEILPILEAALVVKDPSTWLHALMDYGAYIKRTYGNQNTKSAHYAKQPAFRGSKREARGYILRLLLEKPRTRRHLLRDIQSVHTEDALRDLLKEGLVTQNGRTFALP